MRGRRRKYPLGTVQIEERLDPYGDAYYMCWIAREDGCLGMHKKTYNNRVDQWRTVEDAQEYANKWVENQRKELAAKQDRTRFAAYRKIIGEVVIG